MVDNYLYMVDNYLHMVARSSFSERPKVTVANIERISFEEVT